MSIETVYRNYGLDIYASDKKTFIRNCKFRTIGLRRILKNVREFSFPKVCIGIYFIKFHASKKLS